MSYRGNYPESFEVAILLSNPAWPDTQAEIAINWEFMGLEHQFSINHLREQI